SHVDDGRATLVVAYDGGDGSVVLRILHLHGKPTHAAVHEGDLAVNVTGERHFAAVIACTDAVVHFDKVSGQAEALRPERRGACRFDAGNGGRCVHRHRRRHYSEHTALAGRARAIAWDVVATVDAVKRLTEDVSRCFVQGA